MSRAVNLQRTFDDLALTQQGVVLEPLLAISDFLDDHEGLITAIQGDLQRGLKNPDTGRKGLTAPQILRSLVLMRVKNWDYRELRERIADGITLRRFTDFYCQPVPKHDAFQRGFVRLTAPTIRSVNEVLVQAAVALGLEDGNKLSYPSTPRSLRRIFIIPPTTHCCGMSSVSSLAWSAGSQTRLDGLSRGFATARARRDGACWRSSG
jgi:IS5 family transposase